MLGWDTPAGCNYARSMKFASSRLTRYRSKDRAGWPPPPKLTDEASLGRPQLTPQIFRVVLLEGTDDGELTYVGSDPRTVDWMYVDDEDYRAQACSMVLLRAWPANFSQGDVLTLRLISRARLRSCWVMMMMREAWHLPCLD